MGEVLYEVSFRFEPQLFVPLIMLIAIPLWPIREKRIYGKTTPASIKIMLTVMWCIVLVVTILAGRQQYDLYRTVTDAYKSGQYQIVEGYVENFDPMPPEGHKVESFDINGVHFSYSDNKTMTGYHNAKCNGGVITGNGQYLRIGYIYYDSGFGNVIVYIEELPPA